MTTDAQASFIAILLSAIIVEKVVLVVQDLRHLSFKNLQIDPRLPRPTLLEFQEFINGSSFSNTCVIWV